MIPVSFLFAALAIFEASATQVTNSGYQSNNYNVNYGSTMPIINTQVRTPIVENPTIQFPSFVSPTTISDSCHCLKTVIRPQVRNELITVPTIDRILRTVSTSPVVEAVNYPGTRRLEVPSFTTQTNNIIGGDNRGRTITVSFQGNNMGGFNGVNQVNSNGVTSTNFNVCSSAANNPFNGVNFNGYNEGSTNTVNRGTSGTFPNPNAEIFTGSPSGVFSSNSVFSNDPRIRGY